MNLDSFITLVNQNIAWAPYLIFGLLLLAGLNIPVSEDAMLFISATLAATHPEMLTTFFIAVFLGAYFSDLICYGLGRFLGPRLLKIDWFKSMVSEERITLISNYYERYGVLTLVFGRFIPFGVRNGLFLTAGLGKMPFVKFSLSDLLAATISCSFFFSIYYRYGKSVIEYVKTGNKIVFGIFLLGLLIFVAIKKLRRR